MVAVSHTIKVQGVREMIQLLDAVQPDSVKELRKEFRQIALPVVAAIKSNIPSTAPLSGMNHYGRTRYNGANVKTELALGNSIRSQARPLATIVVESPTKEGAFGLEIADMAGRKTMMHGPALTYEYKGVGRVGGSGRQKPTKSRKVVRRGQTAEFSYRITGQGKGMTDNLGGIPSRYEGANVKTELALGNSIRSQARPLATIVVESPTKLGAFGLEIADMAGRKSMMHGPALKYEYKGTGRVGGSGRQNPTKSRKVVRRGQTAEFSYRITGQGKGMTDNLGGVPSRYIYPALAGKEDQLVAEMQRTLDKYSQKINYKLKAA